jgi:signal transduction histidine kinase
MAADKGLQALVVTPNEVDARLAVSFLGEGGVAARSCAGIDSFGAELERGLGCVVLVEEALVDEEMPLLHAALAAQPPWSDLPLVLVASEGAALSALIGRTFPDAGNVTVLQRPLNPVALVSAVQVGLRARARQLEVRDLLAQRDEALRHRDEFLAMLAHELRNPLAPMRNAVYLQQTLQLDHPLFTATRGIFDRQVRHLSRLVDDLLDVARLERGKVQLQKQRLDLNAAATAAVDASLPHTQERRHTVRIDLSSEPLPVDADPVRIEQLITNLVANAAKYTPAGGEISIRTAREDARAVVTVRDNGVGIRPDMLEKIFSLFTQAEHSLDRTGGGLGIGLTVARRLAELHDGTLEARSEGPNLGATFIAGFPLDTRVQPEARRPAAAPAPVRRRRVLVIEDNADIRESLRIMLSMWGHDVMEADTGGKGLEVAVREKPDIAFIDIGLPGMNGYDVAKGIRRSANGAVRRIKLIAITGYGQNGDRERALESGFDAHLLKPVDPQLLEEALAG